MARVELEGLWVHDPTVDPAVDYRRYETVRQLTLTTVTSGSTWTAASGRTFSRRRPGRRLRGEVTIRAVRRDVWWLADRAGQTLLWRTFAGSIWGVAREVPRAEVGEATDLVDVRLQIDPVTPPSPLLRQQS